MESETLSLGIDPLLESLRMRFFAPRQPKDQMVELGCFVEDLHKALRDGLGFKANLISEWHIDFAERGQILSSGVFGRLQAIYGWRNVAGHPNEEIAQLDGRQVHRDLETLEKESRNLLVYLGQIGRREVFVVALYKHQRSCQRHCEARRMIACLKDLGSQEDLQRVVKGHLATHFPGELSRFEKIPTQHRVSAVVMSLARKAHHAEGSDPLTELAVKLQENFSECRCEALDTIVASRRAPLVEAVTRLEFVVRLTVDQDPSSQGAFLIRDIALLSPRQSQPSLSLRFPLRISSCHAESREFMKVLGDLCNGVNRTRPDSARLGMRDMVLQFEVPAELACEPFEDLRERIGPISVLCVTVRPQNERFIPGELPPSIAHPDMRTNSMTLEGAIEFTEILRRIRDTRSACLFASRAAWTPKNGSLSPVVEAFDEVACAILDHGEDLGQLVQFIYRQTTHCTVVELFSKLTELRRTMRRLTVLWDDESYDCPLAQSV